MAEHLRVFGHVGFFCPLFQHLARAESMIAMNARESATTPETEVGDGRAWLSLYRSLATAREIDRVEKEYVRRGLAFFHVAGAGHEVSAVLAPHLMPADWLHCHYRDKALLLQRGVPIREFFLSLFCKAESHSAGRQMSAHLSAPALNVLSIVGPVGNNALQAVGVAAELKGRAPRAIVVCSVGDGTTQQGEFLEAVAEAVREQLPVLFLVEDNRWSISTPTGGRTFLSRPDGPAREFYGLPVQPIDGRDPVAAFHAFGEVVRTMRIDRRPALIWLQVERLADHSNADDQSIYRNAADMTSARRDADPVANLRQRLLAMGIAPGELRQIDDEIAAEVAAAAEGAVASRDPDPVFTAKRPLPPHAGNRSRESLNDSTGDGVGSRLTMGAALRETLRRQLRSDDRVVLFGEDIEDPKGDVFGVTRGLSTEFPGRVRNSPLSESTIVGVSIGRALAGARPVAFLQFADFLPLACNQIAAELGSLDWRSAGAWQAPVIILISCGGYRPGLGPFHSQTFESLAAHVPGVDVVMPATAGDAAGLLNAAFASGRPTLFFYPKSCLNLSEYATAGDVEQQFVPLGACRTVRSGEDVTFVSWGYPVLLCEKAAGALAEVGIEADVLDLRSLSPWDEAAVRESAEKTGRLIVVHEDNHTCGFGAEVIATVAETARRAVRSRRVTRPDTWVPCHFPSQLEVLPSFRRVLSVAAELLDLDLSWEMEPAEDSGTITVDAVGSGPADETVIVTEILVATGATVAAGDVVATAEAEKSVVEISAHGAGVVTDVLVAIGDAVPVGQPLIRIRSLSGRPGHKAVTQEQCGRPVLKRRTVAISPAEVAPEIGPNTVPATRVNGQLARLRPTVENDQPTGTAPVPVVNSHVAQAPFRDVSISARQRLLNRRMEQSLRVVPQGTITQAFPWEDVLAATRQMRDRHRGLAISEFDVLAFCTAQATSVSPRLRSVMAGEATLREYERLNLGIAVHLAGDELATAVIRGADQLPLVEFIAAMQAQIEKASAGNDQASHDTQLIITHFGGFPITEATPVLISPAVAVLFVGAPAATSPGSSIKLTLAFDHRLLNGVAAARFLCEIGRSLDRLREPAGTSPEEPAASPAGRRVRGELRQTLQATLAADRRRFLEDQVGRIAARLLRIEVSQVEFGQPLRNQGLDSFTATELALTLANRLNHPVPQTLVWNHPTIQAVASHLLEQLGMNLGDLQSGLKFENVNFSARGGTPPETLLSEIARLSDEQARILLDSLRAPPGRNPE